MPDSPPFDRRRQTDRRTRPTTPWSRASLFGARAQFRRKEDAEKYYYVDRYSLRACLVIFVTLLLSVSDAFLTLRLISLGAVEANPVMNFFLTQGPVVFLAAKYLITGVCLLWFLVYKNYRIFGTSVRVKHLAGFVMLTYVILIVYEIVLLLLATSGEIHSGMGGTSLSKSFTASSIVW